MRYRYFMFLQLYRCRSLPISSDFKSTVFLVLLSIHSIDEMEGKKIGTTSLRVIIIITISIIFSYIFHSIWQAIETRSLPGQPFFLSRLALSFNQLQCQIVMFLPVCTFFALQWDL